MVSPETDLKTKFWMPIVLLRLTLVRGKWQKRIGQMGELNCDADLKESAEWSRELRSKYYHESILYPAKVARPPPDVAALGRCNLSEACLQMRQTLKERTVQAACQPQLLQLSDKASSGKDLGTTPPCLLPCV